MYEQETGDDRLAAICQTIRAETLEPAKQEAAEVLKNAEMEAQKIKEQARQHAEQITYEAKQQIAQEQESFKIALEQAARQSIDMLRQQIERTLFPPQLNDFLENELSNEQNMISLIQLIVEHIEKEGLGGELDLWLSKKLPREKLALYFAKKATQTIPEEGIHVDENMNGFMLKVQNQHLCLEMTTDSLRDLIGSFLRSDFRKVLFS